MKDRVLFIDDNQDNLDSTAAILEEWGYAVEKALGAEEGLVKGINPQFAVILIDYRMPGIMGAQVAKELAKVNQESVLVMYSCDDSREATKEAWDSGVTTFIEKNINLKKFQEKLLELCHEYHEERRLAHGELDPSAREDLIRSVGMVGRSSQLAKVAELVKRFQKSRESVVIIGETGTGKELVARALHRGPDEYFKGINCSSLNGSSLVESELFGHEKGSFTGAITSRIGIIEQANGGTVFFDELHLLDKSVQGKLLRVFQEKKIRRVGGHEEYDVNFRLVTAVQPDIQERIADGRFVPDLYNRIDLLSIYIPPLRERPEDIEPLVRLFCQRHFEKTGERKFFLAETIRCFERQAWAENVRGVQNLVTKLLHTIDEEIIQPKHLDPKFVTAPQSPIVHFKTFRAQEENNRRGYFQAALEKHGGNAYNAALALGMSSSTFYDYLKKYGIQSTKKNFRAVP